jgi:phage-related protein
MSAPTITIDGHVLNQRFNISEIKRPFPDVSPELLDVPGRDGQLPVGISIGTRSVSFRIWSFASDSGSRMAEVAWLMELLYGSGSHVLSFSDEPGLVRGVMLDGAIDYDEYEERGSTPISLTMPDPYRRYSTAKTVTFSSSQATFTLDHAHPRMVIDAVNVLRRTSDNLWMISFDGEQELAVELPSPLAGTFHVDCETSDVVIDGAKGMIAFDSDWPELSAGTHTVQVTAGSSTATLSITERCI